MKKLTTKITVTLIIIATILAICLIGSLVWGKTIRMAQANRDLTAGRTAAARKTYEDLAVDLPESPQILHNLGLTAYRQGRYPQAAEYFQKALEKLQAAPRKTKKAAELAAKCHYHLGNARFKLAETAQTGKNAGQSPPASLYRSALADFRNTLKIDPADQDAKYNYELTKLRLDEAKQQKQNDQNQKDQKQSDQNKKQTQDRQQPNQQNKDHQQPNQNNQSQGDQKQSQNQNSQGNDQKSQNQPSQQAEHQKHGNSQTAGNQKRGGMTRQEAKALLDAAKNDEQYMAPMIEADSTVQKDW